MPQAIKRILPKTLFGRALLIMILPALLVQFVLIYQFYERHWDSVVRNMSSSLAGEIDLLYRIYETDGLADMRRTARLLGVTSRFVPGFDGVIETPAAHSSLKEFYGQLSSRIDVPVGVTQTGKEEDIQIRLLLADGLLVFTTDKKRLVSSTTYIFLLWVAGSSLLLLTVATLFLRNQIRPIRQLAQAAEQFGLGQDVQDFRPRGASEVRQAGRAFLIMRNRILRQVNTRTEMLAGISHDLRTPLTRMKLQLAMLPIDAQSQAELGRDIVEMEHMIDEYLQFARGQGQEETQPIALDRFINDMLHDYRRQQQPVSGSADSDAIIALRPMAMRRALQNIIDNAVTYGGEAVINLREDGAYLVISVRDKGPGIPNEAMEEAFRPFTRLDPARNQTQSGAGLGLSISRDIVQAHGGTIELRNHKKGLEVVVNLPKTLEPPGT